VREFVLYTISGLTTAGIYAITASGLTLTYTTTGVFNFAHGAVGMVAAFSYWQLRFDWGVPAPLAIAIVLLVLAPLTGVVFERVVMRQLQGASEVTSLVVTVALLLGLVSFALWVWDPSEFRSMRPLWSGRVAEWGIVRISYNDLAVLVIAASVAAGLRVFLYRTRVGVAMRATVDDPSLTRLNGSRPVVNARVAWIIGTMLAALAGVLVAPKLSLSPLPITLLIVNAYAAAVIGRLRSLPMTFVGAIVLGLLNDYAVGYLPKIDTGQQYLRGLAAVVPVVVLFVALLVMPSTRVRGTRAGRTPGFVLQQTWTGTLRFGVATIAGTIVLSTVLSAGDLFNITKVWGLAIIGLSMVPLVGWAGNISLCQLSFGAVGAIVVGHLGRDGNPIAIVIGVLAAAAVGAIVALPALRLSGIYLALSTAAFAVALDRWIFQLPPFTVFGHRVAIFEDGSLSFARPEIGPLDLTGDRTFFVFGSVVFMCCAVQVVAVRRRMFGVRLLALKDSPVACVTIGVDVRKTTLGVFTFSAAIAGLGGAMYGMALQSAASNRFDFMSGVSILLAMVVGGIGSIGAAVFAGVFLGGPTLANLFPEWTQLTSMSIALAAVAVGRNPDGFIPTALRPLWAPVTRAPRVLAAFGGALVVVWVLRLAGALDNWGWAIATLALVAVLPHVAARAVARGVGDRHRRPRGDAMDDRPRSPRLERFDRDIDALRRPSAFQGGRWLIAGAAMLAAGVACAIVAFIVSHGTTSDLTQRDATVVALIGITVSIAGAAVYLRATLIGMFGVGESPVAPSAEAVSSVSAEPRVAALTPEEKNSHART
jgi:branched-chain amino acid transport system permease protein